MHLNADVMFNKLVLFTVQTYIESDQEAGMNDDKEHAAICKGIDNYRLMGRFSKEEHKLVVDLGKHKFMLKLRDKKVSRTVFALELLRTWVNTVPREKRKNIYIGVGNKKLMKGSSIFVISMLKLKASDPVKHKELRGIIDESRVVSKLFYDYASTELQLAVKQYNKGEYDEFSKVKSMESLRVLS